MTRIVAGKAKGRKLAVPKSGTRPTSERAREALFSRLDHLGYVESCAVLDLFAGSGALGLEAASRGARRVDLVEANQAAASVIRKNVGATGLDVGVHVIKVEQFLQGTPRTYDLVMLDPPYDLPENTLTENLAALEPWLATDAMIVVERARTAPEPTWPMGVELNDERRFGDTRFWSAVRTENTGVE